MLLRKLKQLQVFGHSVHFVVGDFTARIGDPTGRNEARPVPTVKEIEAASSTYREQALKVLDPAFTEFVNDSTWLSQLRLDGLISLSGKFTVAQIIARDDFASRFRQQTPIHLHELLYPLVQAYDSVKLRCDIELGC